MCALSLPAESVNKSTIEKRKKKFSFCTHLLTRKNFYFATRDPFPTPRRGSFPHRDGHWSSTQKTPWQGGGPFLGNAS